MSDGVLDVVDGMWWSIWKLVVSVGDQNITKSRQLNAVCCWVAFPVICHRRRRPRSIAAGFNQRC